MLRQTTANLSMAAAVLRKNEQLLRRCQSVEHACKLVPKLIVNHDNLLCVGRTTCSKPIYQLPGLADYCWYIPSYFDDPADVAAEILTTMVDSPPHSNSLPLSDAHSTETLWKEYQECGKSRERSRLNRLRWSCVGYHYDWGQRTYSRENVSSFPETFSKLYNTILSEIRACTQNEAVVGTAESAIINLYHSHRPSDRLGGHRDDVELTDSTPLLSLSLGLTGIFLIESEAIVLNPGDVVVMAGTARHSLHGVPCIFAPNRKRKIMQQESEDPISDFLGKTRISVSIRQVY